MGFEMEFFPHLVERDMIQKCKESSALSSLALSPLGGCVGT